MLAIKLMRTGAKKSPSYRVVVKEKQSKRDGAYLENLGTYNPTRDPAEIKLNLNRVNYWIEKGAQPTDTVNRLIKASNKADAAAAGEAQA
jgi:small subunit ribosomal protein S16